MVFLTKMEDQWKIKCFLTKVLHCNCIQLNLILLSPIELNIFAR